MAGLMSAQVNYANQVSKTLTYAIKHVDDDYMRAVLALTQEFVYSQTDVMRTYVDFNCNLMGLRMSAIESQLSPEKGNYFLSVQA